jgi:hypothetical protein
MLPVKLYINPTYYFTKASWGFHHGDSGTMFRRPFDAPHFRCFDIMGLAPHNVNPSTSLGGLCLSAISPFPEYSGYTSTLAVWAVSTLDATYRVSSSALAVLL